MAGKGKGKKSQKGKGSSKGSCKGAGGKAGGRRNGEGMSEKKRFMKKAQGSKDLRTARTEGGAMKAAPKVDPAMPCSAHLAGHCRFGIKCRKQHDLHYAFALRDQFLSPRSETACTALEDAAVNAMGEHRAADLFPRVLSSHLELEECKAGKRVAAKREAQMRELCCQGLQHLLIMRIETEADEITEIAVLMVDTHDAIELGRFHRWVRPERLFDGCDIESNSCAIPFGRVLVELDLWLQQHVAGMTIDAVAAEGSQASFVTCGDKEMNQIRRQCEICCIKFPRAFCRWIDIKEAFSDSVGKKQINSLVSMLSQLNLLDKAGSPKHGLLHLAIHDTENICRCVMCMVSHGVAFIYNSALLAQPSEEKMRHTQPQDLMFRRPMNTTEGEGAAWALFE